MLKKDRGAPSALYPRTHSQYGFFTYLFMCENIENTEKPSERLEKVNKTQ